LALWQKNNSTLTVLWKPKRAPRAPAFYADGLRQVLDLFCVEVRGLVWQYTEC
jgi:hypothetical protein